MPEYSEEILDSNSISSTDKAGRPIPVTIPIALAPGIKVVYTTRLGGLSAGDYGERLLEKGQCLMEIKGGGGMPVGLARILSDMQIYPVSFSKYGNVYKNMLRSEAAELRAQ